MSMERFTPDELTVKRYMPGPGKTPVYSTPITPKENMLRMYQGKTPMWVPMSGETSKIMMDADPERVARNPGPDPRRPDGKRIDGWGVEWIFVDVVGGAMVKPGAPMVTDIEEWEKQVKMIPDPDTWDWKGCAERSLPGVDPDFALYVARPGCLFERLIALMDFENAAVALIDEDQKEATHRLLRTITDIQKKAYTYIHEYLHPDIVCFNDDWGSQRAEFFSVETAREMLLPYVTELCSHVHSLGMYWDLHCCGFVEGFVPLFCEAGYDSWGGQPMNDKWKLKQLYGDKMLFTAHVNCPKDATEEEQDRIIKEFFDTMGADNRCLIDARNYPDGFREKLYEAGRKNYDRLVAEGKAIL